MLASSFSNFLKNLKKQVPASRSRNRLRKSRLETGVVSTEQLESRTLLTDLTFSYQLVNADSEPIGADVLGPGDEFTLQVSAREDVAATPGGIGSLILDIDFDESLVETVGYSKSVINTAIWQSSLTQTAIGNVGGDLFLDDLGTGSPADDFTPVGDGEDVLLASVPFRVKSDVSTQSIQSASFVGQAYTSRGLNSIFVVNSLNLGTTVAPGDTDFGSISLNVGGEPQAPSISIAPTSANKAEGNSGSTPFTFTVTRSGDTSAAGNVNYAVTGTGANSANAQDFAGGTLPSGTASFSAGETAKTVTINVNGDTTVEENEGFTVTLSNASAGASITTAAASGTIQNDDSLPPPTLAIAATSAAKNEGNSGTTAFTFNVTRTGDTSAASSVNYAVTGNGANSANAQDFAGGTLPSGTASFSAGETSKTVTINVNGDTTVEENEGFTVTLSNATGGTVSTATANGTIQNDDFPPTGDELTFSYQLLDSSSQPVNSLAPGDTFSLQVFAREDVAATPGGIGSLILDIDFDESLVETVGYSKNVVDTATWQTSLTQTAIGNVGGDLFIDDLGTGSPADDFTPVGDGENVLLATIPFRVKADVSTQSTASFSGQAYTSRGLVSSFIVNSLNLGTTVAPGDTDFGSISLSIDPGVDPADLEVISFTIPSVITVGTEVGGRVQVQNVGDTTSSAYQIFVFISDDDILDVNTDLLVLPEPIPRDPLGAGQTDTVIAIVQVPADFQTGSYTVFVGVDDTVGSDEREFIGFPVEIVPDVSGSRQIVSADDVAVTVGGQVQIPVQYSTSDSDNTLGAFGFRLHYNSSELQFDRLTNVFQNFKIQEQLDVADTSDFDGDSATDRYVLLAWADPTGNSFPNEPLPLTLYNANFTVAAGLNVGDTTTIQFSGSATALSYSFEASPVTVTVQEPSVYSITAVTPVQDEGDNGTTPFMFTVTRSGAIGEASTVDFFTTGTGSNPADASDFSGGTLPTGTVTFASGETSKTVELLVSGDVVIETDEQFTVTLSNPTSGGTIDVESASSTITNDDGPKQIISGSNTAAPAGGKVQIPVQYSVSDGDNTLGTLAFRMHYNSSELQFDGLTDVFQNFKIQEQLDVADTSDFDNDAATDRYVLVAWADPTGNSFPNEPLPLTLYKANFTVDAGLNVGDSSAIQFSGSQTALTHFFRSSPLVVTVLPPVNLDVDNDGTVQVASDGFLILRYMFGFTGAALTDGVLANGAQRTDPGEIVEFLDGGRTSMLDVDDDGTVQVASDGFLILRYMFGFTGTSLTDGVLAGGAQRTDPGEIVSFLDSFDPGIAATSQVVSGRPASPLSAAVPLSPAISLPVQTAAASPVIKGNDSIANYNLTRADELLHNSLPLKSAETSSNSTPLTLRHQNLSDDFAIEENPTADESFRKSSDDWSLDALYSNGLPAILDAV